MHPKQIATIKQAPTKSLPHRPGPIQCIRNCTNCIMKQDHLDPNDPELENVIAIKSYDNLVHRQGLWFSKYQSIQYHPGQIDVLKRSLKLIEPHLVVYVVAVSRLGDIEYLQRILNYTRLPIAKLDDCGPLDPGKLESQTETTQYHKIAPIDMKSCNIQVQAEPELLEVRSLRDYLAPLVEYMLQFDPKLKAVLVPVTLNKDHDKSLPLGYGSICVQIMEPYSLGEYLRNKKTEHKTGHLVQHLYHDLAMFGARLPCQLVAFLLLYLDRPYGVSLDDLIEYMNWLRKNSMEFDIHMAFTGEAEQAIKFGLMILNDYIQYDTSNRLYRAINVEALAQYAYTLVPNVAYHGLISRAILMLHNHDEKNPFQVRFSADLQIKVMKDDLLELSQDIAELLDNSLPCRRPCVDVRTHLLAVFDEMQTFGKYFRVREARARPSRGLGWLGDYDSDDDDYYWSRRDDPAFKPWIVLTKRPYRLDRLNLFMNAIDAYLS